MRTAKNYFQLIYNILTIVLAGIIAIIVMNLIFQENDYSKEIAIIILLDEIFVLSNLAAHLYDTDLLVYFNVYFRILSKSFLLAAFSVEILIVLLLQSENLIAFSLAFFIIGYLFTLIGIVPGIWFQQIIKGKKAIRTAFVGSFYDFQKANFYINKTSMRIDNRGYILENENENDGSFYVLGTLDCLEDIIRKNGLQMIYFIQKNNTDTSNICLFGELKKYIDICKNCEVIVKILIDYEELGFTEYPEIIIRPDD